MKYFLLSVLLPLLIGAVFFGSLIGYVYLVCAVSPWFLLLLGSLPCWVVGAAFMDGL